jgi:tRNA (guanine10-N2)-dimethyltransferase
MTRSVLILGRQPALGLAELESLFGAEQVWPLGENAAMVDSEPAEVPMARLGGAMKAAKLLDTLPYTEWNKIARYLAQELPKHVCCLPEGKVRLGLSTYGFNISVKRQNASGLELKKVIREAGRSGRIVPNVTHDLNTAQVLHNQLASSPTGMELLLIADGQQTILAQTFAVQDIEAYAARDQARPKRDARVGMLPPKLAQIIINLAADQTQISSVLDPFCGTGVVLQEALLMGYNVYGTDIEERLVDFSRTNLDWLATRHDLGGLTYLLETGDACEFDWQTFDTIACETYLGRPFSAPPTPNVLAEVIRDVDTIHKKFLKNVARQTKPGFRLCIAVPAWKTGNGFKHLKVLDSLEELGYTRLSFAHVRNEDLIYHRPDQIVARELVVLKRK